MTEKTNLFYDSAADAARAAGVSDTLIIDQCKAGAIPGAYQSSDGWWRVPVDGMRAAGHEVTGEGAHLIGPLDRQLPEPTITTDGTPDHPVFLETEEDYHSAPEGTIVALDDERPAVLVDELWRHIGSVASFNHFDMSGIRRRVLRWGWEA